MHQKNYNIVGFLKKNSFFDERPERSLAASLSKQSRSKQKYSNNQMDTKKKFSKQQIQSKISKKREFLFRNRGDRWKQLQQQKQTVFRANAGQINNREQPQNLQRSRFNNFKRSVDRMEQAYFPSSTQITKKKDYSKQHYQFSQGTSRKRFAASKNQSEQCLAELSKIVTNQIKSIDIKIKSFNQIMQNKIDAHIETLRTGILKAIDDIFRQASHQITSDFARHAQSLKQNLILVKVRLLECQQRITGMQKQLQYNWKKVTTELLSEKLQNKIRNLVIKNDSLEFQNLIKTGRSIQGSYYSLKQIIHKMLGQSLYLPQRELNQVY